MDEMDGSRTLCFQDDGRTDEVIRKLGLNYCGLEKVNNHNKPNIEYCLKTHQQENIRLGNTIFGSMLSLRSFGLAIVKNIT